MKKLLLFICVVLMTACDSSDREQKLADEVLELKTAQTQREADQEIAKLREENQTLKLQLAAVTKGHGEHAEGSGSADGHGHETPAGSGPAEDDSKGAISIVGEGESIVVNPANSEGKRYLLVDIFLTRANENDKGFKRVIDHNSKKLQAMTMDKLSERDVMELSSTVVRRQIESDLMKAYQGILGPQHPIKELIVAKWIMQ